MKLYLDMAGKRMIITKRPEPKNINYSNIGQRIDKETELPMWVTQAVVLDEDGGTIVHITTVGEEPPDVEVDDEVNAPRLEALPWSNNGRSGVAYRATTIDVVDD